MLRGKHNSVFLEFEQRNFGGAEGLKSTRKNRADGDRGTYIHRNGTHGGKRLGNVMGMSEFKNQAREKAKLKEGVRQGVEEDEPIDHDLAEEIDQLRQIQFDKDIGYVEMEGPLDDYQGHDDDRWFHFEQRNTIDKEFYQNFLNSVKCTAFATDRVEGETWGACTPATMACAINNNTEQEKISAPLESRDDGAIVQVESENDSHNVQIDNMMTDDGLRELEEYRDRQNAIDQREEQEMERIHQSLETSEQNELSEGDRQASIVMKRINENRIHELNTEFMNDDVDDEGSKGDALYEEGDYRGKEGDKAQSSGEQGNFLVENLNGVFSAIDELRKDMAQIISRYVKCGEDMEVLDIFKNSDEPIHVPIGVEEERRKLYDANEHEDLPPTALYAAIGTRNWNIALMRLFEEPAEASKWVKNASTDGNTEFRFLPLHLACLSGAPLLLVTLLVQTYPNAVKYTAMGKLPIHLACETLADDRVVFLLLNAWPESINIKDDNGMTPIEVASSNIPCDERKRVVQILTKKMDCSVVKTPTALYTHIDSQNWNSAMRRLVQMPQEATTWVSFAKNKTEVRFLPLHIACVLGAPFFLVSDLVHAYPDAVRKKTTMGDLPLHIACQHHSDERVVELLLKAWPESLFVKNDAGNTALEVASATEFSPERTAILALLQKKLEHKDRVVYAPTELYSLIEAKQWDAAVRRCSEIPEEVSTWVGSCTKMKDAKLLPLHIACSMKCPLILVAVLIQTYPEGVKRTDNVGRLPIHLACENNADHRIIALLLHTWPQSFNKVDEKGYTPVQVALTSQSSTERTKIVETLMAFESKTEKDTPRVTNPTFHKDVILTGRHKLNQQTTNIDRITNNHPDRNVNVNSVRVEKRGRSKNPRVRTANR
jgi:ankyrin repeat protein